jgi:hypothetical protein
MPLGKNREFCVIRLTHIGAGDVIARAEWRGRGSGSEVLRALATYVFTSLPAVNGLEGQAAASCGSDGIAAPRVRPLVSGAPPWPASRSHLVRGRSHHALGPNPVLGTPGVVEGPNEDSSKLPLAASGSARGLMLHVV